jgi:hypothetical protein
MVIRACSLLRKVSMRASGGKIVGKLRAAPRTSPSQRQSGGPQLRRACLQERVYMTCTCRALMCMSRGQNHRAPLQEGRQQPSTCFNRAARWAAVARHEPRQLVRYVQYSPLTVWKHSLARMGAAAAPLATACCNTQAHASCAHESWEAHSYQRASCAPGAMFHTLPHRNGQGQRTVAIGRTSRRGP